MFPRAGTLALSVGQPGQFCLRGLSAAASRCQVRTAAVRTLQTLNFVVGFPQLVSGLGEAISGDTGRAPRRVRFRAESLKAVSVGRGNSPRAIIA